MALLGWSKTKVLAHLKEVQEYFEFRTVKDPLDNRRSVQRLHGIESPATTAFFDKCLKVVDDLVAAREEAKKLRPEPEQASPLAAVISRVTRATRLLPIAAAGWLAAWMVFDTDKVEDIHRWSNEAFDHSVEELIEPVEHLWHYFCDDPSIITTSTITASAPATPQSGSRRCGLPALRLRRNVARFD